MTVMAHTHRRRPAARLLLVCLTAIGTVAGTALGGQALAQRGDADGSGRPAYDVHTSTDCRAEARLARRGLDRTDVRVDVDGDGRRDRVAVVTDTDARKACRVVVAVKVRGGDAWSTALDRSAVPPRGVRARLAGLPDLGNDPGAEIVVDSRARVDGVLAQLFTLTRDGLVRKPMPAFEDGNFYVEGGGVTYPRGASCNARGAMILSMATLEGDTYQVTRHVYPVRGDRLHLRGPRIVTAHVDGDALADAFPEFGSPHFVPCTA